MNTNLERILNFCKEKQGKFAILVQEQEEADELFCQASTTLDGNISQFTAGFKKQYTLKNGTLIDFSTLDRMQVFRDMNYTMFVDFGDRTKESHG